MKLRLSLLLFSGLALCAPLSHAEGGKKPPAAVAAVGPLGDLTNYMSITKDTLKLVDAGDLKGGKARIKDLETAWDVAEEKMRPMSQADWETVDQAIDRAIGKLRSPSPKQEACKEALTALLDTFDKMQHAKK